MSELPIEMDVPSSECDCHEGNLVPVPDHPANSKDWNQSWSTQGYEVFQCENCGDYWGCRYQYDAGTGHDDRWHRFGQSPNFKRHY